MSHFIDVLANVQNIFSPQWSVLHFDLFLVLLFFCQILFCWGDNVTRMDSLAANNNKNTKDGKLHGTSKDYRKETKKKK